MISNKNVFCLKETKIKHDYLAIEGFSGLPTITKEPLNQFIYPYFSTLP